LIINGLRVFIWASRFAGFARSRRAIRSITFAPHGFAVSSLRWFRCYPSRNKKSKSYKKIKATTFGNVVAFELLKPL
jgi:hypothetical protein